MIDISNYQFYFLNFTFKNLNEEILVILVILEH